LLSTNIKGKNKILFQSGLIALATSVAAFFFISHADERSILEFWKIYQRLSYEAKFALGVLTIGATYFGGALYVGNIVVHQAPATGASSSDILQTPATQSVKPPFDIPDTLDADDKVFFESMLERCDSCSVFFSLLLTLCSHSPSDLQRRSFKISPPLMRCPLRQRSGFER
jgi:hypothetical protein